MGRKSDRKRPTHTGIQLLWQPVFAVVPVSHFRGDPKTQSTNSKDAAIDFPQQN